MITMKQALTATIFHDSIRSCNGKLGPHRWRRNGKTRTWKTRPTEFAIPVKYGMYGYGYITQNEADQVHTEEDCPDVHT